MWNDREVVTLDRYIDHLNGSRSAGTVSLPLATSVEMVALLHLARKLKQYLTPVEPSPQFTQALHTTLVTAASARTHDGYEPEPWPVQHKREILIGAAVGSALSIAGVVAVVLRGRGETRHAA